MYNNEPQDTLYAAKAVMSNELYKRFQHGYEEDTVYSPIMQDLRTPQGA